MQENNFLTILAVIIPIAFLHYLMVTSYLKLRDKRLIKKKRHEITGHYEGLIYGLINGDNGQELTDLDLLKRAEKASEYYDPNITRQMRYLYAMAYRYSNDMLFDNKGKPYYSKDLMLGIIEKNYTKLKTMKMGL